MYVHNTSETACSPFHHPTIADVDHEPLLSCSPFHNLISWHVNGHQHGSEISKPTDEQTSHVFVMSRSKCMPRLLEFHVPASPRARGKGEQHKGPCVNSCLWAVSFPDQSGRMPHRHQAGLPRPPSASTDPALRFVRRGRRLQDACSVALLLAG